MKDKHKGMLAIMLGGPPHEGDGEAEHEDVAGEEEGYHAASEEMIDAIHAKDPKAFSSALHSYIRQCLAEEEKGEPASEEEAEHEGY